MSKDLFLKLGPCEGDLPEGGTEGHVLIELSDVDGNAGWLDSRRRWHIR